MGIGDVRIGDWGLGIGLKIEWESKAPPEGWLRQVSGMSTYGGPGFTRPTFGIAAAWFVIISGLSMGEVPEWTIGAVSKTVEVLAGLRGFESHPLRWKLSANYANLRPAMGVAG